VELGTYVTCTAFRNAALLARMAETLDEISGGRFILGLGAGCDEPEFRAYGFPFERRRAFGLAHLLVRLRPNTLEAVHAFAEVLGRIDAA